jgi:hypothetical protein
MNAVGAAATPAAITFLTTGQVPATGVNTLSDNVDSYLRTPHGEQAGAQISQEISNGFAISGGYLMVHGVRLQAHTPNFNALQTGVFATGKAPQLNIKDLNTVYGGIDLSQPPNPLLGYLTPRDVFNPRQMQYGLKLRF